MHDQMDVYPYRREGKTKRANSNQASKRKDTAAAFFSQNLKRVWRFLYRAVTLEGVLVSVAAFFLGRAEILGELMPFGPAFLVAVIAVWGGYAPLVFLSIVLSVVTSVSGVNAWAYIFVLVFLAIICYAYPIKYQKRKLMVSLIVFVTILLVKGIFALFFEPTIYQGVVIVFEAAFAGALAMAYQLVLGALAGSRDIWSLSPEETLSLIVLLVGIIGGMEGLVLFSLSLQRIVGNFLIMVVSLGGGAGAGAAAGTLMGIIPSLTKVASPSLIGVSALAGLLAGVFNGYGRLGVIAGYLIGHLIFSVYLLDQSVVIMRFMEIIVSCMGMIVISEKMGNRLRTMFGSSSDLLVHKQLANISSKKVEDLSRVFNELSRSFSETGVTQEVEKEANQDKAANIINLMVQKACRGCPAVNKCWEIDFYSTYKSMLRLFSVAETKGRVTQKDVSGGFQSQCTRTGEIATAVNFLMETFQVDRYWRERLREAKDLLSQQLGGVANIMGNLVDSLTLEVEKRGDLEALLSRELSRAGINFGELSVYRCGRKDLEVNLKLSDCRGPDWCTNDILPVITKVMGRPYTIDNQPCRGWNSARNCYLRLIPAWSYHIEIGCAQVPKQGTVICGDTVSTLSLKDGKMALLISDGMGVGPKAARESTTTVNLLQQLMEAGFDIELAVKTVNSIMMMRALEDTFTTLDLTLIDLYSGEGEFVKIGAMPSWIKRGYRVETVTSGNLPIGILSNLEIESLSKGLQLGDLLLMVSDGMEEDGEQWLVPAIRQLQTDDPQEVANLLLDMALNRQGGKAKDDLTVLIARVDKKNI